MHNYRSVMQGIKMENFPNYFFNNNPFMHGMIATSMQIIVLNIYKQIHC